MEKLPSFMTTLPKEEYTKPIAVEEYSKYGKNYQIRPGIDAVPKIMLQYAKPLIKDAPQTFEKDGKVYKTKKILKNLVDTINYYIDFKLWFIDWVKFFDRTIMTSTLNKTINPVLLGVSSNIKKFEDVLIQNRTNVQPSLQIAYNKQREIEVQTMAGIGWLAPLGWAIGAAGAAVYGYFTSSSAYDRVTLERDRWEYTKRILQSTRDMHTNGATDLEMDAYLKRMIPGTPATVTPEKEKTFLDSFLGGVQTAAKTGMVAIAVALGVGVFLLIGRKKRKK